MLVFLYAYDFGAVSWSFQDGACEPGTCVRNARAVLSIDVYRIFAMRTFPCVRPVRAAFLIVLVVVVGWGHASSTHSEPDVNNVSWCTQRASRILPIVQAIICLLWNVEEVADHLLRGASLAPSPVNINASLCRDASHADGLLTLERPECRACAPGRVGHVCDLHVSIVLLYYTCPRPGIWAEWPPAPHLQGGACVAVLFFVLYSTCLHPENLPA